MKYTSHSSKYDLNLSRDKNNTCISKYCSQLPEQSHYDKTDLNPFFYKTPSNTFSDWFVAVETDLLQIYSIVHAYTLKIFLSQAYSQAFFLKHIQQNLEVNPVHLVHLY